MDQDPYSETYLTSPELWDKDASFLLKAGYPDGSQVVAASGWHRRQIVFEHPAVMFNDIPDSSAGVIWIEHSRCDEPIRWSEIQDYELEVSLDALHIDEIRLLIASLTSSEAADSILESMESMVTRVSANRANAALSLRDGMTIETADLLCQNLPARSGNLEEPLRTLSRWCRIFKTQNGTITIYKPLEESQKEQLRWPHNCIWLNRGNNYYLEPSEKIGRIEEAFKAPVLYELYNLENWRVEFEFWENRPFQIVLSDDSDTAAMRLGDALKEVGILSDFVTTAFLSARNLKRRIDQNVIVNSSKVTKEFAEESLRQLEETIVQYRRLLETASALLANTAQSVQAVANRESVEATEKTNAFLALATAIFFVPTLVISFYSMSIFGVGGNNVVPSAMFVFALCIGSAIGGLVVVLSLWVYQKKRQVRKGMHNRVGGECR